MKKVAVAVSGGMDSSAAAAVLKQKGFSVIGMTMLLPGKNYVLSPKKSSAQQVVQAAKNVCDRLKIRHYVIDCRKQLEEKVIKDFVAEYKKARTPNPCIRCNKLVKFPLLLKHARNYGADFLATGHYVRKVLRKDYGRYFLKKPVDKKKDQSYFLYGLDRDILPFLVFPLSKFTRQQVIRKVKRLRLPVLSTGSGSQEICFIGSDYKSFLEKQIQNRGEKIGSGLIKDSEGNILGRHKGIYSYTVGQRKGLGIAAGYPLYVVKIDSKSNTVIAGRRKELDFKSAIVRSINLFIDYPKTPLQCKVKIRYKSPQVGAELIPLPGRMLKVVFVKPQPAVTPGQSAVFYDRDYVLGGGIIERVSG